VNFIGIDVHKKDSQVCIWAEEGEMVRDGEHPFLLKPINRSGHC
jgi:hypothetical protein